MTRLSAAYTRARALYPGVAAAVVIAMAASLLGAHYGAPVMLFALLIGMAFNFLSETEQCAEGVGFAAKTLLRLGVALLGARITVSEFAALGVGSIATIIGLMAATIAVGFLAARLFGRGWRFALLTGGSVAICGASAALALAAVIPRNPARDVQERNTLFTIAAVTMLSTIAMIAYPVLFQALDLSDAQIGFLIGATIHDVAQVVGAGYSVSTEVGDTATLVKLIRVSLLPVVLLIVIAALRSKATGGAPGLPWFVTGFIILSALNSLGLLPALVAAKLSAASQALLVVAIAALGVKTSIKAFVELGPAHIGVVVMETLLLLGCALLAVTLWL